MINEEHTSLSEAFQQGRRAYVDWDDNNPYPMESPLHEAWIEGWVEERDIHKQD
jgi:hypothetical protein